MHLFQMGASVVDQAIRVLCVDDNADLAEVYATVIDAEDDMESVGVLGSADTMCAIIGEKSASVALVDLTMPGKSPLEAIEEAAKTQPGCRVIVISGYDDKDTVDDALQRGAWGFVSKHGEMETVLKAIRAVARGEVFLER